MRGEREDVVVLFVGAQTLLVARVLYDTQTDQAVSFEISRKI